SDRQLVGGGVELSRRGVGADDHHHRGGVRGEVGGLLPQLVEGDPLLELIDHRVVVHHLPHRAGALSLVEGEGGQLLLLTEGLAGDRGRGGDRQLELVGAGVVLGEVVQRDHHVGAAGLLELAHHELAGAGGGAPMDVAAVVAWRVVAQGVEGDVGAREVRGGGALEVAQESAGGFVEPHGAGVDEQFLLLGQVTWRRISDSGSSRTERTGPTTRTARRLVGTANSSSCAASAASLGTMNCAVAEPTASSMREGRIVRWVGLATSTRPTARVPTTTRCVCRSRVTL